MPRNMAYEASSLGEDLLWELMRRGSLAMEVAERTKDNVYAVFHGHLVPVAQEPLLTPFSVSLSSQGPVEVSFEGNFMILTAHAQPLSIGRPGESPGEIKGWPELVKLASVLGSLLRGDLDLHVSRLALKLLEEGWPDPEAVIEGAQRYVGAGAGSTPSFDDFLAGYITGWGRSLQARLDLSNTTHLSRAILSEVLADRDYLVEVARVRESAKGRGDLLHHSLRVASMGGSSGIFMLLGVTSALLQRVGEKDVLLELWRSIGGTHRSP